LVRSKEMAGIRGLAEVVLIVGDMQESLHFYRDTLGLTVISPPELRGPVFLRVGAEGSSVPQQIVLAPRPPGAGAPPTERAQRVLHHIGIELEPEQFEAEWRRLEGAGLAVRTGEHPFLPVRAFYVDDPDGNEVEFVAARSI